MRILLVGGGGREHAIGWKLRQSSRVDRLMSLPGNPGLAQLGSVIEGIDPINVRGVATMAGQLAVDLVVVGSEAPLAAGLVDALRKERIPVWGPTGAAARLESSKKFAKEVMDQAGVATAEWKAFVDEASALAISIQPMLHMSSKQTAWPQERACWSPRTGRWQPPGSVDAWVERSGRPGPLW